MSATQKPTRLIGEIVNPSDAYTIDCTDRPAACFAVCYISQGAYSIRDAEGGEILPLFLFGGDPAGWFKKEFGIEIEHYLKEHRDDIARACRSAVIGDFVDRDIYEATIAALPAPSRDAFRTTWHDKRRSSMNDIGGTLLKLAEQLEAVSTP